MNGKKIRILFVCHGNICRSPMAEFVMKDVVRKHGVQDRFAIESCATSSEELGHDMYPPAKSELDRRGVPYSGRSARRMTSADYGSHDLIVAMDRWNIRNMKPFVGDDPEGKVSLMMSHAGEDGDVEDPWYTGDFSATYECILRACEGLLSELLA